MTKSSDGRYEGKLLLSLMALTDGKVDEFHDPIYPPAELSEIIQNADADQIRGMLIEVLRRWHEVREGEES